MKSQLFLGVTALLSGYGALRWQGTLHMVYATDLTFFVVPLAVSAVLLWRRTPWGYLLGTVMAVTGATYLVNLMAAAAFQAHTHVAGVAAFSPLSLALDLVFIAAGAGLLATMTPRTG